MATMDQAAWANVNVLVGKIREPFTRGALLPEPGTAEEAYDRQTLRLIGAIRVVDVVYTAEELAAQMQARGEADAAREAAGQVDVSVPLGDQTEQAAAPGPPTVSGGAGAPVVIGDEDLKAEHEAAAKARKAEAKPEADEAEPQHRQASPRRR
jgi:hypothetical protein